MFYHINLIKRLLSHLHGYLKDLVYLFFQLKAYQVSLSKVFA